MSIFIQLNENDNVIIALKNFRKGDLIEDQNLHLKVNEDIQQAHKIALKKIQKNEPIIKYGMPIGIAKKDIEAGDHVHVQNTLTTLDDIKEYKYEAFSEDVRLKLKERKINVYKRENGDIGIRNELWVIPTVGCVNASAENIAKRFIKEYDTSMIDGVYTFTHPYGCSQMGDDHENTKKTLQNITKHPNAGGVLVLGLGCENNQIESFKETLGRYNKDRIKFLAAQDVEDEISSGVDILKSIYTVIKQDVREETPISSLKIGLECGGSDGLSGITANPLLGHFSDYIVSHNGTTVLTEVPEMFGAETLLMKRACDEATFNKMVDMINDFKNYYKSHNQVIYENPSPGNKKGGITTLEDKSLGCTQKSGTSIITDVLRYNEKITRRGVNLLSAPGNDLVATTALGASGCHLVLFSTGRGTPFGGFVPTVKISSNNELYHRKRNWMDFNAGELVNGKHMEKLLNEFIDYIIDVVNGKKTKNEINEFREIAIFKDGVTL